MPNTWLGRIAAKLQKKNTFRAMTPGSAYLQFQYYSALTEKNEPFPDGTAVKVEYIDAQDRVTEHNGALQITGTAGKVSFGLQQRFRLKFRLDFSARPYFNVTDSTLLTPEEFKQALAGDWLYLTKKAVMLLPAQIDLTTCVWEITSDLFNAADGKRYFEKLDKNELKGDSEYLPVVVKPDWLYLSLRYHDPKSGDELSVPQGLWMEGIHEKVSDDIPVAGSSLVKDKSLLLPWFLTRDQAAQRDGLETVVRFKTRNLFVKDGKLTEKTPDEVWSEALLERYKYFDLPAEFNSDNWRVKHGSDWRYTHNFINERTAKDSPLMVYLDSVVLTDDKLKAVSWDKDERFAAMDPRLEIVNPDPDRPYWTKDKAISNFISPEHAPKSLRLIAYQGKFYDVTHKRCVKGGPIGARAAVLDDASVHHGEALLEPLVSAAGNFEVHYLRECLDADDKETVYLLIYWSAKVAVDSGADATDLFKKGFTGARQRWASKKYTFEPRSNPNNKGGTVRPLCYFEGRDTNPAKCTVSLHPAGDARASMGLHSADFLEGNEVPGGSSVTEDGVTYEWFVMAHELGHAIGLEDEYVEPIEESWNPVLPAYDQYYPGMPYASDQASMMNSNQAPRLRHLWHLCRWLNETAEVKQLTGDTVFHVQSALGPTYKYYLHTKSQNYLKPRYKGEGYVHGTFGKMDLFLYRLGQDEATAKVLPGQTGIKGILVVAPRLAFAYYSWDTAVWADKNTKVNYIKQFQNHIAGLNRRIYLEGTGDASFKKIYVHFMPHYHFEASGSAHVTFKVVRHNSTRGTYAAEFYGNGFTGSSVMVDQNQNHISMMRYVLGLKPYGEVPATDGSGGTVKQARTSIDLNELSFLADWVKSKRNHDFTVKM